MTKTSLKIGSIDRKTAVEIDSLYVRAIENITDMDAWDHILQIMSTIKVGQLVLTVSPDTQKRFIIAKVSSVNSNTPYAVDGPVIRVSDGKSSWRVDGDGFCVPVKNK